MSLVQIRVVYDYYASKRTTPFFITEDEILECDFDSFKARLLREVPYLAKSTSAASLRLTMNDEDLEIDLSPVYFNLQMKEMLGKQRNLTIQAFSFDSPSVQQVDTENRVQRQEADKHEAKYTRPESLKARRSLSLQNNSKCDDLCDGELCEFEKSDRIVVRATHKAGDSKQQTPLERYIAKTEEQIIHMQERNDQLKQRENSILAKLERVKSDPRDGNICRSCHLRLGHSARTCQYGRCTSVFKCGEEKFHSGEVNMREMRNQVRKNELELRKLQSELENKRAALQAMNDKQTNRIESDLFQANRGYLVSGNKNWSLLRKHVYLVEQYSKKHLGGKIPGKNDVTKVLEKALSTEDEDKPVAKLSRCKKRENNPAKSQLERQGIKFPRASAQDCDFETREFKEPSAILYTAPKNEEEEAEQLAIVVRESLRQKTDSPVPFRIMGNPFLTPPFVPPIPFYGRHFANRMNNASLDQEQVPSTSTSTCATTNTNPKSTVEPTAAEEAANLLLSLSRKNAAE